MGRGACGVRRALYGVRWLKLVGTPALHHASDQPPEGNEVEGQDDAQHARDDAGLRSFLVRLLLLDARCRDSNPTDRLLSV